MCAISGLFGEGSGSKIITTLKALEHRGPDGSGIFVDSQTSMGSLNSLKMMDGQLSLGHNLLSIVGSDVQQPLISNDLVLVSNAEIYNYEDIKKEMNYDFKTDSDCEVILALLEENYSEISSPIPKVTEQIDGDYAFIVSDGTNWAAVRDPVGIKPLFYGQNKKTGLFGVASERKALWKIGIQQVESLNPRNMIINRKIIPIPGRANILCGRTPPKGETLDQIKEQLKTFIINAVKKRVAGLEHVGVIFSGGVDSTLLALICKNLGVKTSLYTVGRENSSDIKFSHKAAAFLDLPLHNSIVDEKVVRKTIPSVLEAIEEWNIMKIGVGMTAYLAAEVAKKDKLRVLLSGQGADELFGGYQRYLRIYSEEGEVVERYLAKDVEDIYHVNLERDDAVTMAHSVELRVPYLDLQVLNRALNIPMKYKIKNKDDKLRKYILREVARELGVPPEIAYRPKKAAQYGSGIHQLLVKKVLKDDEYLQKLKSLKFI
jgi:asparagine synthase (glutamine-hydrolysing)